jgi:prolipoprotein diacylglyceryltransferase
VHPAALYEMAALLAFFVLLLYLRSRVAPAGALFAVYLLLSGAARASVEIVRTNRPVLLGLTEAQWTSIALGVGAAVWLWRYLEVTEADNPTARVGQRWPAANLRRRDHPAAMKKTTS